MKKTLILLLSLLFALELVASPRQEYVEKYYPIAVREMYRSGIPASITLAQGLLESRVGKSDLAIQANNHFGIKAYGRWKGRVMRYDDDESQEPFRAYDNVEESFRDHSDFLRYRDRYKKLFDYKITDYKSWAKGLKKAGYATDSQYANKLIKLIEEEDLAKYDSYKIADLPQKQQEVFFAENKKIDRKKAIVELPASPTVLESPRVIETSEAAETYSFPLSRQLYSQNGVPFIYALEGETFESIAKDYELFLWELLKYNDLRRSIPLYPKTIVYLQAKRREAAVGVDKFIVDDDKTTLRDIAQRFGVKVSALCKINNLSEKDKLTEGMVILLRKKK